MKAKAAAVPFPIADDQVRTTATVESPIATLPEDDPFAASNFAAEGEAVPASIDDVSIELGAPSDEEFVLVSSDQRHTLKANLLVVNREDG